MARPKLTKLELQIMDALWNQGILSLREIQEAFPAKGRPAYTTIQTTVYRLEDKGAVRRAKKISNAHIFEAVVSREAASGRLIDDLVEFSGAVLALVGDWRGLWTLAGCFYLLGCLENEGVHGDSREVSVSLIGESHDALDVG